MNSIEWDRESSFIFLSVNFNGYKRLQILIQIIFRNHDFSELVFLISLMIWFLDVHSEYYEKSVEFEDASIDVLDNEFWWD